MRGARALAAAACLLAGVAPTAPARAAGGNETPAAASALATLGPAIAKGLGVVPAGALVVASPLVSDHPAPKGDELASRVAALVAGSLGGAARPHPQPASLSVARAIAGKRGALVYLQLEIAKGELRATADLYPVVSNGWDRLRAPLPPPRAHAFVAAPLDAEVRTFLPSLTLERAEVHKARHDETEVLAAACGDVDGDGGMELVVVSRARVTLGRVASGRLGAVRAVAWSRLSGRAGVPMREPLGAAVIDRAATADRSRAIRVGATDRASVALDADLGAPARLRGMPVSLGAGGGSDACVAIVPEQGAFEGDVVSCSPSALEAVVRATPPAARFVALAAFALVGKTGAVRHAIAAREPGGKLRVRLGDASLAVDGVGAQIALGDLDQDGELEVVTSASEGDDAITVASWDGGGEPRVRLKLPAPGGVRALAVCPPEERGVPALVAVVGDEVWVVR